MTKKPPFSILAVLFIGLWSNLGLFCQEKPKAAAAIDTSDAKEVSRWITRNAVPLLTVEARHGFQDLEPLKGIFKDVRIIALGEATHGTREFFQFKHRMLEFLVKEMGFTVFAIEASYPACLNINNYVLYGKGDRASALASQKFWTWDTNEVSDMIDWMREYNQTAADGAKVEFLGYDLQHLDQAMDLVVSYFKRVGPEYTAQIDAAIAPLRIDPMKIMEWSQMKAEEKKIILTGLEAMIGLLSYHQDRFVRLSSSDEYELALQHARVLVQLFDAYSKPMMDEKDPANSASAKRDLYMAENIEHLLNARGPRTKMVVWAHNGHIATLNYGNGIPAMGAHLRAFYGKSYYALGFAFNQGSFQSRNMDDKSDQNGALMEFKVGPEPKGAVGWYLSQPGIKDFILDLRSAPQEGPVGRWLAAPLPMRSIGSGFSTKWNSEQYLAPTSLAQNFDGIVFIETTTRARPNPTGERGPFKK